MRATELFTFITAISSAVLYGWLLIFYATTKSERYTIKDNDDIFETVEKFISDYCVDDTDVRVFPDFSFVFSSSY